MAVAGWIRLIRPEGGMFGLHGRWDYRFSPDRIVEADKAPPGRA